MKSFYRPTVGLISLLAIGYFAQFLWISICVAAPPAANAQYEARYVADTEEYRLPGGSKLVFLYGQNYVSGSAAKLTDSVLSDAKGIRVLGKEINAAVFKDIVGTKDHLLTLAVTDCEKFSNGTIEPITELSNLQTLILRSSKLDSSDFKVIANFPKLEKLNLANTPFSDADAAIFKDLPSLQVLDLNSCTIGSKTIESLAACKKLEELNISDTKVDEAGFKILASMKTLRRLELDKIKIDRNWFEKLGSLPKLEYLLLEDDFLKANRKFIIEFRESHRGLVIPVLPEPKAKNN